jgi:hypothetical protein
MSKKMRTELDLLIEKFTPPMDVVGGFLSREDFKTFANKVVNESAIVGWVHAERMTRQRMDKKIELLEQEAKILRERVKEVEIELLATQG